MYIPTLADKAALTIFYSKYEIVDFSPYNVFASIIQKFYKLYILRVRACVYIQKCYRGYSWREVIFDFRGTNGRYITTIVKKLRPEWPIIAWTTFIERRYEGMPPLVAHLDGRHFSDGVVSWEEWVRFYDKWVTAFSYHIRPILSRRRMNFHASMYNTHVAFRFHG